MEIWVTEWIPYLCHGVKAYRIQQGRDKTAATQRHEYLMDDGSIEFSEWIVPVQPLDDIFLEKLI